MARNMAPPPTVLVENAEIKFPNFAGAKDRYNKAGDRSFCLVLPEDLALEMRRDGWNVKQSNPREDLEGVEPYWFVRVAVSYKVKAPKIYTITSGGENLLTEDLVSMMDNAEIINCDVLITGYDWEVDGDTGRKAYLRTMYATLFEDELEQKYARLRAEAQGA